jgi:hypothetical protein
MEARPRGINPDAVLRGRIGARQFHATHDPSETTRNTRAAFLDRFERERFSVVTVIEDACLCVGNQAPANGGASTEELPRFKLLQSVAHHGCADASRR